VAQNTVFQTTNALLNIAEMPIPVTSRYFVTNDILGSNIESTTYKRNNAQLTAFHLRQLLTINSNIYQNRISLPTSDVSVSVAEAFDYFPTYKENTIDVKKYISDIPTIKTVTISGSFVISTSSYSNYNFIWDMINKFRNFYASPYMYTISVIDPNVSPAAAYPCGSCLLPSSLKISISGGANVQEATWNMTFTGPTQEDLVATDTALATGLDDGSGIVRTMNTRDFQILTRDGGVSTGPNAMGFLTNFVISMKLNWKNIPTWGGYSLPYIATPYIWAIDNQTGEFDADYIMYRLATPSTTNRPYKKGVINDFTMGGFTVTCLPLSSTTIFDNIYWKTTDTSFKPRTLGTISRKGVWHVGGIV